MMSVSSRKGFMAKELSRARKKRIMRLKDMQHLICNQRKHIYLLLNEILKVLGHLALFL